MDRFSKFHPIVGFSFFAGIIIVTLMFSNSICLFFSLICAFAFYCRLKGRADALKLLKYSVFIVFIAAFFNMLFSRYGATVLFCVKSINFTLESLTAGLFTGIMISAVGFWFFCFNEIVTDDKFMALFGGVAPNFTLLFSMILRFLPLLLSLSNEITQAQKGLGREIRGVKNGIKRFSALISITLEKSIETADTMKARGFGSGKRRFYSPYIFKGADAAALVITLVLLGVSLFACTRGIFVFSLEPVIRIENKNPLLVAIFILYALFPLAVDFAEDIKWLLLRSKI